MTQIVPGLPLPVPAGAATTPSKAPAFGGDAWMKELERARWEAQPRQRAGEAGVPGPGTGEQAQRGSEPPRAAAEPRELQAARARAAEARPTQAGAAAPAAELPVSTAAFLARAGSGQPQGAAWTHTLAATERIRQQVLRAVKAHERSGPGEPWSERNVHVHAEGDGFAVWIRDAGITPERVRELLDTIERLGAEASGRRPIRLTVNGQPFAAGPDSNTTPQAAGERLGN
jgi:hypothetical protein